MSWHEYDQVASIVVEAAFIAVLVILPVIFGLLAWDMRRPKQVKRAVHLKQGPHVRVIHDAPPLDPGQVAEWQEAWGAVMKHYGPPAPIYDQDAER